MDAALSYPTVDEIRAALVARADEFSALTGQSRSTICKAAVNDPAFIAQVSEGRNVTLSTYKRFMSYLDDNWPKGTSTDNSAREAS